MSVEASPVQNVNSIGEHSDANEEHHHEHHDFGDCTLYEDDVLCKVFEQPKPVDQLNPLHDHSNGGYLSQNLVLSFVKPAGMSQHHVVRRDQGQKHRNIRKLISK